MAIAACVMIGGALLASQAPARQVIPDGPSAGSGVRGASDLNVLDPKARAIVARVNKALNGISKLRGRFLQQSETSGQSQGTFYINRPGRLRFEYDPPSNLLFVVDGTWVGIDDKELQIVNRYPLNSTPLSLLLKEDINLLEDTTVTSVQQFPGQIRVTVKEEEGFAQGELTLIFAEPSMELRQWIVVDAQGTRTSVQLRQMENDIELKPELFVIYDYVYDEDSRNVRRREDQ